MGPLDGLITVTIIATNATPQLPNFGTPAGLFYHTHNSDFIRTYTSLAGMVSDGFSTTEPAYLWASAVFAQTPTVPSLKIIRGTTSVAQTFTFKVTDTNVGDLVGFLLTNASGVTTSCKTTVTTGQTAIQIATAIVALAPTGITLSNGGTDTVTGTVTASGAVWGLSFIFGGRFLDTTITVAPATDLNNALTVDTSFYGVSTEHGGSYVNALLMAAWAESNKRFHVYTTTDYNAINTTTDGGPGATQNTPVALKTSGYTYSFGQFGGFTLQFGASALMGQRFTAFPGTDTWAYKQLAAVTADALTATQISNANANNLNYYLANISGVNVTLNGINASGMYADIRRGIDALAAQVQIQLFLLLLTQPKLPYDPNGISMAGGEVASALAQFTASPSQPAALLRNDPGFQPQVILPKIANTTAVDRGNRLLRNLNFVAYAQQGIQTIQVNGSVNT